jgi:hypothetical protein
MRAPVEVHGLQRVGPHPSVGHPRGSGILSSSMGEHLRLVSLLIRLSFLRLHRTALLQSPQVTLN